MLRLFAIACALAGSEGKPLLVVVDDPSHRVNAAALRERIAAELGRPTLSPDHPGAKSAHEVLFIAVSSRDRVTMLFRDLESARAERRVLLLASDPEQALGELTLLAGNVARDEAGELAPQPKAQPKPPTGPTATAPTATAPTAPPLVSQVEEPAAPPAPTATEGTDGFGAEVLLSMGSAAQAPLPQLTVSGLYRLSFVSFATDLQAGVLLGWPVRQTRLSSSLSVRATAQAWRFQLEAGLGAGVMAAERPLARWQAMPLVRVFGRLGFALGRLDCFLQPELGLAFDLSQPTVNLNPSQLIVGLGFRGWKEP